MSRMRTTAAAAILILGTVFSGQMFHAGVGIEAKAENLSTSAGAAVYAEAPSSQGFDSVTAAMRVTALPASVTEASATAPTSVSAAEVSSTKAVTTAKSVSEAVTEEIPPEVSEVSEAESTAVSEEVPAAEAEAVTEAPVTTTTPPPTTTAPIVTELQEPDRLIINYKKQKAMWFPVMDLQSMIEGKTEWQYRTAFEKACQNCCELGINTVYFHARPFADAMYKSTVFPWSRYASGTPCRSPGYDPLEIAVEICHKYELSIHAWINPYRVGFEYDLLAAPDSFIVKKWYQDPSAYPDYVSYVEETGKIWMDPGRPEVRTLIVMGVKEIVENYEVDGIHIDDYFYPTTEDWFDDSSYAKYGGGLSLKDYRLRNCTVTVKAIYDAVKAVDKDLVFGIAPQGNYENNYAYMYADVALWLSTPGYCDYLAPQMYFGYEHQYKPFLTVLQQWAALPRDKSVSLIIGIAAANIELQDEFNDNKGIIASQIRDGFKYATGIALYRYDSLYDPAPGYEQRAASERVYIGNALR